MGAPIQRLWHCVSPWPFRAEGVTMLMLAALPAAAAETQRRWLQRQKISAAGDRILPDCLCSRDKPHLVRGLWQFRAGGRTVYIYLINIPRQEDRLRAMQDCANQNPRKNNRDRCMVTLTGRVAVQSQKAFLTDPRIEWANK